MKKLFTYLLCCVISLTLAAKPLIYQVDLKEEVNSSSFLQIQQALMAATQDSATHLILHMNTYGGEVLYADSIRTLLLNAPMPVAVFIDRNAASAGALISIACDSIYMRAASTIGASTVVDASGNPASDKHQSYMRAMIRATAEAQGRNAQMAEAMVRVDSVLTLTAQEAVQHGFCEAIVEDIPEIIEGRWNIDDYDSRHFELKKKDRLKGFLMGSGFRAVLVMIIVAGIWFELQSPGIGFPLLASIVAAVLYFAPAYIDGLVAYWEIVVFVVGILLLVIELFAFPGFGVFGIVGILCMLCALSFAMVGSEFTWQVDAPVWAELASAIFLVLLSFLAAVLICTFMSARIGKGKGLFARMALQNVQPKEQGYVAVQAQEIASHVGKEGESITLLRPGGKVRIEGKIYDAVAEYGFIEAHENIIVTRSESGQLYVVKK